MSMTMTIDLRGIAELDQLSRFGQTQPVSELLSRDDSHPEVTQMLAAFARGIDEVVAFGTNVLEWTGDAQRGGDELAPMFFSLRHILEQLDAVAEMMRSSCVDPCVLQLRAILEAALGAKYMLDDSTRQRAMGYMVTYAHQRLKVHQRLDPSTEAGKQFARTLRKDPMVSLRVEDGPDPKPAIKNLEELLKRPEYAKVDIEYHRTKKKLKRTPPWYALFDGPTSLQQLAERLGPTSLYHVFYREWSGPMHGTGIIQGRLTPGSDGTGAMIQLRYPVNAQHITQMTMNLGMSVLMDFIREFAPERGRDYKEWYVKIRPFFLALRNRELLYSAARPQRREPEL